MSAAVQTWTEFGNILANASWTMVDAMAMTAGGPVADENEGESNVGQWVVVYNQGRICDRFYSHRLHISAFFPEKAKMKYRLCERTRWRRKWLKYFPPEYYGSARRGERAPEIPVTKSVRVNWRTRKHIFCWLYRPTH